MLKKGKKKKSALRKVAAVAGLAYAGLFAVYYFDLDGKAIYYMVEPFLDKHYSAMERPDATKTPYGPKPDVSAAYYAASATEGTAPKGMTQTQKDGLRYGVNVPHATRVVVTM